MAEEYLTDDEQLEAAKRWVAENWAWVVAGVVLGLGTLYGYRYYESHRNATALAAAGQFSAMTDALQRNDRNAVRQIAGELIKDHARSPYADQAQLTVARLFVDDGALDKALAPLTEVMTQSKDLELRHIARLRVARVLIDQGKPDEAIKTLAEDTPGAFAARFHDVRGDAFYAKHDTASAIKEYRAALDPGNSGGSADAGLIQLKIADLGGSMTNAAVPAPMAVIAPPTSAPAAPAATPTKAKP